MAYTGKKPVDFVDVTESQTFKVTESLDVQGNELVLDADGDTSITSDTDDVIDFRTAGSDRWQILANGNLKAAANGLGIDFSASEGSGASTSVLDDYEVGTWTPTYTNFTLGNATQVMKYAKIGNQVTLFGEVTLGSTSALSAGVMSISGGYPFAKTTSVVRFLGKVGILENGVAYRGGSIMYTGSKIYFYSDNTSGSSGAWSNFTSTVPFAWASGDGFWFTITYEAT